MQEPQLFSSLHSWSKAVGSGGFMPYLSLFKFIFWKIYS